MQTNTIEYDARTDTFTLETVEDNGNVEIALFTAPDAGPFNVCGLDVCAVREVVRAA